MASVPDMAVTAHRRANPLCRECGARLTPANWSPCNRAGSRRQFICIGCQRASAKAYKLANRETLNRKARKKYLDRAERLARYGLTPECYDVLLLRQGGLCAICREREPCDIDHDHNTGQVRGLLCRACNLMLGMAQDSTKLLRAAISYLIDPPA